MNRRTFLGSSSAVTGLAISRQLLSPLSTFAEGGSAVQVKVRSNRMLGPVPESFMGLGYEISSVARPGLLSGTNHVYVQMVKTLSAQGVIRVGGNTADYASYSAEGQSVSSPKSTVVNRQSLEELGSFLDATGWRLIWGLDLGKGTEKEAVEEAQAVSSIVKEKLLAFEIGNEVDLFSHEGHRPPGYTFAQYLEEYRRYKSAIRAKLPKAPFAGPDIAGATDWVNQFASAEGEDLVLLTHHYYRANESPAVTLDMLLNPDPKLAPTLAKLKQASERSKVPYRICEVNSFSGGGRPGISGTFGAALWVLDYMFTLAEADADGVNMETGVNHRGFVSSYSPVGDDEHGTYSAKPEYYGMLAFAQASHGNKVAVDTETGGINLSCYAVARDRGQTVVTLINKDKIREASVSIQCDRPITQATAMRLKAPGMQASTGITLGDAPVSSDGRWAPREAERIAVRSGSGSIDVPPGSAALVTLTS